MDGLDDLAIHTTQGSWELLALYNRYIMLTDFSAREASVSTLALGDMDDMDDMDFAIGNLYHPSDSTDINTSIE